MSSKVLLVEKSDGIATLTLNRPEAMNALSGELRGAIGDAFRELRADADVGVAILTGAGRAFCAGIDLKELGSGGTGANPDFGGGDLMKAMAGFAGPIIGARRGPDLRLDRTLPYQTSRKSRL